jgi:hypothetical protein
MTTKPDILQTFNQYLGSKLKDLYSYNINDKIAPTAALWTDKENQWKSIIPLLSESLPIFSLGAYDPEKCSGPAYWLRCVIAGAFPEMFTPGEKIPILYLPGVSRQEMRAVEECPRPLQPLAELQYRGVLWSQKNGKDWTVAAFLQSHEGGLGIDVSADQSTRNALLRALPKLAFEAIERLRQNAPLKAAFFDALLNPDEARSLLTWLNDPAGYKQSLNEQEWQAFCSICQQKYKFHPDKDGQLNAASLLGERNEAWAIVWERYKEAPFAYTVIPQLLNQVQPPQSELLGRSEIWPQENEDAEDELRDGLSVLSNATENEARQRIIELEKKHGERRSWVWAMLGKSPLVMALEYLTNLAALATKSLAGAKAEQIADAYLDWGWQVDLAAIRALATVTTAGNPENEKAVKKAIQALYKVWLEKAANGFQSAVGTSGYPYMPLVRPQPGCCILFSDALRMDMAYLLAEDLQEAGQSATVGYHLAALPPVTSTSKPALVAMQGKITGDGSLNLNPMLAERKTPLTADLYRELLAENNYQILVGDELGDPAGIAWTEIGEIDSYGHQHGTRVAVHAQAELKLIKNRILALLQHGWKQVMVVTDHGWLLLPGGLPKAYLPEHLTQVRKGRCARIKPGASTDQQNLPWFWDKNVSVAFAPGIGCYEAAKEYEHGGLSPQECVTPVITIKPGDSQPIVKIAEMKWKGLRCIVEVDGPSADLRVDLRSRAGDASSSLLPTVKSLVDMVASLLVEDDEKVGSSVYIVVLDKDGRSLAQASTIVGG